MSYFSRLEEILFAQDPQTKITRFRDFYEDFLSERLVFEEDFCPKLQENPSYQGFCDIKHPMKIRRPKILSSTPALARTLHSIAHIEYSAIDLALDASYRFMGLPMEYYRNWLEVANEEIEHFLLLESILKELGFEYGDFSVHQNLFDAMQATSHSLSHRMGLVHRALEANGLDANPFVVQKIQSTTHPVKKKIHEVLEIILRDEIGHVSKGDKWWHFSKDKNEDFGEILARYKQFAPLSRVLNTQARIQAGYTHEELKRLQAGYSSTAFSISLS